MQHGATLRPEPRGFGPRTKGLAGEYAHEQGWGLEEEQRTRLPQGLQDIHGGTDYEYGAQDFGDEQINTERVRTSADQTEDSPSNTPSGV